MYLETSRFALREYAKITPVQHSTVIIIIIIVVRSHKHT